MTGPTGRVLSQPFSMPGSLQSTALQALAPQRGVVFVTAFRFGVRCAVGRFALRRFAAFLGSLAMTLGCPRLQSKAEDSERRHRLRPASGRPVAMTTAMQPHMPTIAGEVWQTVPSRLAQWLAAMGASLRP